MSVLWISLSHMIWTTVKKHFPHILHHHLSRCAKLILIATSNELEEVWVGAFPVLHLQYLAWYTPSLYAPIGRRIGKVLAEALNVPETEKPTRVQ